MAPSAAVDLGRIAAVVFDTDGVITDTARVHAAAWKRVFDAFLRERARRSGERFQPFDTGEDYLCHVDGKSRIDGVEDFLRSRDITLDPDVVADLAARKDASFLAEIRAHGVAPFFSTVDLVRELRHRGVLTAAVSASRNCAQVLHAATVDHLFDVRVDGVDAARLALAGKPDPALFLAARRLGVTPEHTAVVEDSLPGVRAGRAGEFGLVIGVDRHDRREALRAAGADLIIGDLAELRLDGRRREPLAPHR
ncbi:HAD superfamily hydrolase (TIGR01509 family) [Streptosporangium album]|uniref:HAD superfamily hydrolase (TIGR01509 family) n=1 Tax=Streptosporangium album TaxID=47479 RepID=A0A7W7WCU7_9ACTN|nr:HAD-IA family hydrolase [Streptosporangium album]MBB4943017.1 HAD superfamily hydrolase (TIGR01509 family) [Streptosporangium album]